MTRSSPWKTIWITGASSGIGLELTKQLAECGAKIAVSARSTEKLDQLAEEYASVESFPLDITDAEAVARCAEQIEAGLGPIDLVILSAGISAASTVTRPSAELFKTIMSTNFIGVTNGLSTMVPKMSDRGHGHIAFVASIAGYNGLPGAGAYNASKAALVSLAEASREELAPKGIPLTIINPGFIRTPLTEKNKFPMPFLMEPHKAARIIINGLKKKKYEVAFPWQMVWLAKFLRLMPYPVFFWILRKGMVWKAKS